MIHSICCESVPLDADPVTEPLKGLVWLVYSSLGLLPGPGSGTRLGPGWTQGQSLGCGLGMSWTRGLSQRLGASRTQALGLGLRLWVSWTLGPGLKLLARRTQGLRVGVGLRSGLGQGTSRTQGQSLSPGLPLGSPSPPNGQHHGVKEHVLVYSLAKPSEVAPHS